MTLIRTDTKVFQRILFRNLVLPLALSAGLCAIFFFLIQNLLSENQELRRSNVIISKGYEAMKLIIDAETGLRGYIITGKEAFLTPYRSAVPRVPELEAELLNLSAKDSTQSENLRSIFERFRAWNQHAENTIKKSARRDAAEVSDMSARKALMDGIRGGFTEFFRIEEARREDRTARVDETTRNSTIFMIFLTAILGCVLAWLGRRQLIALSQAYEKALRKQREQTEILSDQAWVRTGEALLAAEMRGEIAVSSLSARVVEFVVGYISANAGAIYLLEGESHVLQRRAAYALDRGAPTSFGPNEGPVSEAFRSGKPQFLDGIPAEHFKWVSSVGESRLGYLALLPLTADGITLGVLEIASFQAIPERAREWLTSIRELVGAALRSALYRSRLQDLLHESQQLTEELQTQQEELKVSNEELAERTRVLLETQGRLESQHAELEQTNEQLEEQAQVLEQQRQDLNSRNEDLENARRAIEDKAIELENASRYKSEFMANMSHELRTPLNSSLILAKLLADNPEGNLTPEQVEFATTIQSSGNDLLNLINDILDLSKVEAGKLEICPEKIELRQFLEHLERSVRPISDQKGLELRIEVDQQAPAAIYTDRQRLDQILRNLLSNAVKFTDRGSVVLKFERRGKQVAFVVRDTGIGIRADQKEVIFEAFRQADGTTNRKYGGTGLGLSISRNLSHLLGGDISVQSSLGEGSTFTLVMPEEYQDSQGRPAASESVSRESPLKQKSNENRLAQKVSKGLSIADDRDIIAPGAGKTILIVEDDLAFARTLVEISRELGFKCLVGETTQEGFDLARRYLPSAILLDMKLPDALGLSLLDRLKADPKVRHIPVQAVSVSDYSREALRLGAIGYSQKSSDREALKRIVSELSKEIENRTKRVLIVEDDRVQRSAIEKLIGEKGVEIESVESAREAMQKLNDGSYDCAIVDLSLPDMSGFDFLETLARERGQQLPPIIVYTARSLTRAEEDRLSRFSKSIIIKGARSPERLLDEVTLFLHQSEAQLSPEQQRILSMSRNRERAFEGRRILLVDDDVRNIFALTSALEHKGATVLIARNGRDALEKLDQNTDADLVLMDIMMPEMDGYQAMREIRAQKRFQSLPIIAVTAKAMRDDYEKCLEAGANDYLAKPIDVDKLIALMRVWLPQQFARV